MRCQHEQGRARRQLSGGGIALADQDTIVLLSGTQARADWRALISAAFIGSGVGLSLGAAYLVGGLGQAAAAHGRAERLAEATQAALPASALRPAMDAGLMAQAKSQDPLLTNAHAPAIGSPDPDAARVAEAPPSRARELECLTQAVYFEARGESARGQAAVATVIMNRVKNPNFPKTVCGVVYQGASHRNGCQFSFACDGLAERVVENGAWDRARQVAARALSGVVLREVGKATHFHTTGVSPDWGPQMLRVAQVGLHVFYRFNPHAPRTVAHDHDDDDDAPVFTAHAATPAQQQLRLAAAVVPPTAAEPAGKPAAKPAVQFAPKVQTAPKIELPQAPVPIAQTDTGTAPS